MPEGLDNDLLCRALLACGLVAMIGLFTGRRAIRFLARRFREPVRSASATLDELHRGKQATPTMGGLFILAGVLLGTLLLGDWRNPHILVALAVAVGMGVVGLVDDLAKLRGPSRGLNWKRKLCGQFVVALLPAAAFNWGICSPADEPLLLFPGEATLHPSWLILPWTIFVVAATTNAVNLSDGLDGLAAGCLMCTLAALGAIIWFCVAEPAGELLVVVGAMLGGLVAFLFYNRHPARVFMGNVGASALGGLLAYVAIATGTDTLLPIAGGVFVVEALSVIAQVGSYKLFGRRVLRCAPLHHHFEFAGYSEPATVRRFWALAACAGVLSVVLSISGRGLLESLIVAKQPSLVASSAHEPR